MDMDTAKVRPALLKKMAALDLPAAEVVDEVINSFNDCTHRMIRPVRCP